MPRRRWLGPILADTTGSSSLRWILPYAALFCFIKWMRRSKSTGSNTLWRRTSITMAPLFPQVSSTCRNSASKARSDVYPRRVRRHLREDYLDGIRPEHDLRSVCAARVLAGRRVAAIAVYQPSGSSRENGGIAGAGFPGRQHIWGLGDHAMCRRTCLEDTYG